MLETSQNLKLCVTQRLSLPSFMSPTPFTDINLIGADSARGGNSPNERIMTGWHVREVDLTNINALIPQMITVEKHI